MAGTPLDPGDALSRYPTLSHTSDPFKSFKQRQRHWQHTTHAEKKNSSALGTFITRSMSATTVPRFHEQAVEEAAHRDQHLADRSELFNNYSPRQIAGYCHYEKKAKRLTSFEYAPPSMDDSVPAVRTRLRGHRPGQYSESTGLETADIVRLASRRLNGYVVARKAVGSSPSAPPAASGSAWGEDATIQKKHVGSLAKAMSGADFDGPVLFTSPSLVDACDSQFPSEPFSPVKPKLTIYQETSIISESEYEQNGRSIHNTAVHPETGHQLLNLWQYLIIFKTFIGNAVRLEDRERHKVWLVWTLKLLFILYLASCVWNVVAAVHYAVLQAFEPLSRAWRMLSWLLGL